MIKGGFVMGEKVKWYKKGWVLWTLLIFMPYIGIPFMWITKKDFTKKRKLTLTAVFGVWLIFVIGMGSSNSDKPKEPTYSASETNKKSDKEEKTDSKTKENNKENINPEIKEKDSPDIPGENEFEKSVWKIVEENKGELISIETIDLEDSDEISIVAGVLCENNEDVVNSIIDGVKEITLNNESKVSTVFTFGDIKKGKDGPVLLLAAVNSDGTTSTSMESIDYNTKRNNWIRNQFSAWDGNHTELKKLVVKNLNDEKSYKHIETNYIDINSEERVNEVNKILSDAGYSQRVELDDLFITSQFSAKNAFGGTVKNTAYGIANYTNNRITLIGIE